MLLKRTLANVAVDSARDYLRERLEELKQLDLDHDGRKDVDQIAELLTHLGEKVKEVVQATDFQKLATGLEQMMSGLGMIGQSVDQQKLNAATSELIVGLRQLGKLLNLGIQELKRQ